MENTHNFSIPSVNLAGVGAIKDLSAELLDWKLKKALIVCDKNMIDLGYVERIETILKNLFITYDIFDGVLHPEPTVSFVEDGLAMFDKGLNLLKRDYSLIISIGGGSNHDCAKAIAIVATNGGSIIDYEGYNKVTKPGVPVICINTTGGSGAEVTMSVVITDTSRKTKMTITSPEIMPIISVNDPMLMASMPRDITASCGIDVIVHALEGYLSTEASPISDAWALKAIETACEYLPRAYENGFDLEAREQMMYASVMGGMVINAAGLGYTHALAHQVGGYYHHLHGFYSGVLLPHVFAYNAVSVPEDRLMKIADAMHIQARNPVQAVDRIIDNLLELNAHIGVPREMTQMGINADDIEQMALNALHDITAFTNPRKGTVQDMIGILKEASGSLVYK